MPLTVQKVDVGSWSVCAPKHTAGELDTLPFRAAIWTVWLWTGGSRDHRLTLYVNDFRSQLRVREC